MIKIDSMVKNLTSALAEIYYWIQEKNRYTPKINADILKVLDTTVV